MLLLLAVLAASPASAVDITPRSALLWHLSGAKGLEARVATGGPVVRPSGSPSTDAIPAPFGSAVVLSNSIRFPEIVGHISLEEGTVAFWLRMPEELTEVFRVNMADPITYASTGVPVFSVVVRPDDEQGQRISVRPIWEDPFHVFVDPSAPHDDYPDWMHLAITWDRQAGTQVYVNGGLIEDRTAIDVPRSMEGGLSRRWMGDSTTNRTEPDDGRSGEMDELVRRAGGPLRWTVTSMFMLPRAWQANLRPGQTMAIHEMMIVDRPLSATSVMGLVTANSPGDITTVDVVPPEKLDTTLQENAILPLVSEGSWVIRQAEIESARASTNPGWHAVDGRAMTWWPRSYKRTRWADGGGLHVTVQPDQFNWLRIDGPFWGEVFAAPGIERPGADALLKAIRQPDEVAYYPLDDFRSEAISFWRPRRDGVAEAEIDRWTLSRIRRVDLFSVRSGPLPEALQVAQTMALAGLGAPDDDRIAAELVTFFDRDSRNVVTGHWGDPATADRSLALRPARPQHIVTPAMPSKMHMAGIRLRLRLTPLDKENVIRVTVQHPHNLASELCAVDLRVAAGTTSLDLVLDTRDVVLPEGQPLWVSMASREALSLTTGGADTSRLEILTADPATVLANYVRMQTGLLAEMSLQVSEPRWREADRVGAIERMVEHMLPLAPEDPAWIAVAAHRGILDRSQLAADTPLPEQPGVPEWVSLAEGVLGLAFQQADWWMKHRVLPTGEMAAYDDDTVFMQSLGNLALIGDPGERLRRAYERFVHFSYSWPGRGPGGAYPPVYNGLNTGVTDPLHAHEEGINSACAMVVLDYGNPIYVEELLRTVHRMKEFTEVEDGKRAFVARWWGTFDTLPSDRTAVQAVAYQPALTVVWYNRLPHVAEFLTQAVDFWKAEVEARRERPDRSWGWPGLLFGAYHASDDLKYPTFVKERFTFSYAGPLMDVLDVSDAHEDMLSAARDRASQPYGFSGTRAQMGNNNREDAGYTAWRISGDKADLLPSLRSVYQAVTPMMPLLTYIEQSNDRIYLPSHSAERMYLGGLGLKRNMLWPHHAVSYEGLYPGFAALVTENQPESLRVTLFNTTDEPRSGKMRVWQLVPGRYRVTWGADLNGDDRINEAARTEELDLKRYAAIPLDLPPGRAWVVEAELIEPHPVPLHERMDLALTYLDATFDPETRTLGVAVHNIGSQASGPYRLRVITATGEEILDREMPSLDMPTDGEPSVVRVKVPDVPAGTESVKAEVSPTTPTPEIATHNNAEIIPLNALAPTLPAFGWNRPMR